MINNLDLILSQCDFNDESLFYHGIITKRRKDFGNDFLDTGSKTVKYFEFSTEEDIRKQWPFLVYLANSTQSRIYINLNRRCREVVAGELMIKLARKIRSKQYIGVYNDYVNIVMGLNNEPRSTKKWLVDIDTIDVNIITECLESLKKIGSKLYLLLPTTQGYHLITDPFPITKFKKTKEYECKKDSLILCYYKYGEITNDNFNQEFINKYFTNNSRASEAV